MLWVGFAHLNITPILMSFTLLYLSLFLNTVHHLQPLAGQTRPIRRPVRFSFIRTPFFTIQKPKLRKSNEIHISNFIFLRNKALHTINKIKSENTEKRKWTRQRQFLLWYQMLEQISFNLWYYKLQRNTGY